MSGSGCSGCDCTCVSFAEAQRLHEKTDPANDSKCVVVQGKCVPLADAILEAIEAASPVQAPESVDIDTPKIALRRALFAEAIGTAMIVLFGCGSVLSSLTGAYQGIWQVAAVWGFGVALAIYTTAEASGAHLNPAVTLAFLLVRPEAHAMTGRKALLYMVAQLVGAVFGGVLNLVCFASTIAAFERSNGIVRGEPASIKSALAFGEYFPNPGLSLEWGSGPYTQDDVPAWYACAIEAWGTAILSFVIFALTNQRNTALGVDARPGVPLMIGATVSVLLALYAPITQAGWNPARDFGPRLVAAMAGWGSVALPGPRNGFWIYIVGPFVGGPVGAYLAEHILWRNPSQCKA